MPLWRPSGSTTKSPSRARIARRASRPWPKNGPRSGRAVDRQHSLFDQVELVVLDRDGDSPALVQIAEEDALRQRLLEHLLDEPRHGPRPELRREAVVRHPLARLRSQRQLDG